MIVSAFTGSDRFLAPGVDVVLEVVRMAVNEQFPTLMPTFYPGSMATDPKPHTSLEAMWKALSDLAHNKTPAVNGDFVFSLPISSSGSAAIRPVAAPARRSWARPGPSAVPVAFMADGIEP